jgi:deoxyribonuclease-1-like protein
MTTGTTQSSAAAGSSMRLFLLLLLAAAGVGAWYVHQHYELSSEGEYFSLRPRAPAEPPPGGDAPPAASADRVTIRVASFNVQPLGTRKAGQPQVFHRLAEIVLCFDVIALQGLRTADDTLLPRLVDEVNATGRQYAYLAGPRLPKETGQEQYAVLFDRASVEIDRAASYTIQDPDNLLYREPLVVWLRVRGPPEDEAFTFKLVSFHAHPGRVAEELDALVGAYRAVRGDGSGEDDVLLVGTFYDDLAQHAVPERLGDVVRVVTDAPTTSRGTQIWDNIVLGRRSTTEFTGRGGVLDLMREFDLSLEEAQKLAEHQPVWAEFRLRESPVP